MKFLAAVLAALALVACAKPIHPPTDYATKLAAIEARTFVHALSNRCSGVVVAPGFVLTAAHCATADALEIVSGSKPTVVAIGDERLDYALVAYPPGQALCPCARLASREADLDEPVLIVGYPYGVAQIVTFGLSQGVQDNERMPYGRRLITTAQVAGGSSGGGVFVFRDGEFQLVGVLVEGAGHLSFAVPLADVRPFLERAMPQLLVAK